MIEKTNPFYLNYKLILFPLSTVSCVDFADTNFYILWRKRFYMLYCKFPLFLEISEDFARHTYFSSYFIINTSYLAKFIIPITVVLKSLFQKPVSPIEIILSSQLINFQYQWKIQQNLSLSVLKFALLLQPRSSKKKWRFEPRNLRKKKQWIMNRIFIYSKNNIVGND